VAYTSIFLYIDVKETNLPDDSLAKVRDYMTSSFLYVFAGGMLVYMFVNTYEFSHFSLCLFEVQL
jgi:hypothetical protein